MVDLKSKVKRVDAIQSFVSQERPSSASPIPTARSELATATRSAPAFAIVELLARSLLMERHVALCCAVPNSRPSWTT
jgi:hypothetical protein